MPKEENLRKRKFRIAGIVILVVLAAILVFNAIITGIIEKRIDHFLGNLPLRQYHFRYDRLRFHLIKRSVSLTAFQYCPDSVFLDSLDKLDYNVMVPAVAVENLTISGINLIAAIYNKKLIVEKIKIKKPVVMLYEFNGKFSSAAPETRRGLSIEDSVKLVAINGLTVKNIIIKNINFKIYNYRKKKTTLSSKNITLVMHGLNFENSRHRNHYFYPVLHDARMVADNNFLQLGNSMYQILFKRLAIDLKHQSLVFKGFHYRPVYSKKAFSQHLKFQKVRFDMKAGEIRFAGADFYRFFTQNEIHIRKVIVSKANLDLYRDKRVPFDHSQRPLLPNQLLKRMKGRLYIDTVQIKNTRFEYGEKLKGKSRALNIFFTGLSGYITHITNISYLWRKSSMRATIKGRIMHKAPLKITFLFPFAAKSDTFSFRGAVFGPVPLSVFNPAIYPAAGLKFEGGVLDKLTFKGTADTTHSAGVMEMLYHGIDIQALKKKGQQKNRFLSWGVNSLVRKNNPRIGKDKSAKKVCLFFRRDMEKGLGNFFWETIFSGIKATLLPGFNKMNCENNRSLSPAVRPVPEKTKIIRK